MKTAIAAIAACFVTATAYAGTPTLPIAEPEIYRLKQIEINQGSRLFPAGRIANGMLSIDKENRQIILSIQPAWQCPPGALCAMVMPQPIVIAVPIVYEGGGFAGGRIIVGESSDILVDGTLVVIEIMDNNSFIGNPDPVFEPMQVNVSEHAPASTQPVVSTMQALPARR